MNTQELIKAGLLVTNSDKRDEEGKIILDPGDYYIENNIIVHNYYGYIVIFGVLA